MLYCSHTGQSPKITIFTVSTAPHQALKLDYASWHFIQVALAVSSARNFVVPHQTRQFRVNSPVRGRILWRSKIARILDKRAGLAQVSCKSLNIRRDRIEQSSLLSLHLLVCCPHTAAVYLCGELVPRDGHCYTASAFVSREQVGT